MERMDQQENQEQGRLERVGDKARKALDRTRDQMAAGASGLAEASRDVAERAGGRLNQAAEVVREADRDEELGETVAGTTEKTVHRAGATLNRAAPSIGRGAERIADKAGDALHYAAGPLARILGVIAATIGGWWKQASTEDLSLPESEDSACRQHFSTVIVASPGMTYERARTGYALGFVAARNPEYRGRRFEDIESDLRTGFGAETQENFDHMRDFARFGYERGIR